MGPSTSFGFTSTTFRTWLSLGANWKRRLRPAAFRRKKLQLWNRLEYRNVSVKLLDRGERDVPDLWLQLRMLEDALDNNGRPGIVALLTGDGAGYAQERGFNRTLERMHKRGWRIEVLSWARSCHQGMRRWAEANGVFVALDEHYDAITFREPSRPGHEFAPARDAVSLDLSRRRFA